ncbi:MAG: sigma-54-dependent Fis family transcriptional regulator [Nitrospirae bacterium]|nr:sigma-54-dependent Fis family transcriptional regulator [Nitrospirota bacterium]
MNNSGKVFLLDDDELIISVLSKVLKKEGYDVYAETGTDNVVDKIKSLAPDVLLLDIMLSGQSGMDILREIKHRRPDIQVVMLTSDDSAETAVKAMKLGAEDYLTKPFDTEEVKIVIKNIIEKGRLKHEVDHLRRAYSEFFETEIVGESGILRELCDKIKKMAQAHVSNVLITGESGTGKELIARHMHALMHGVSTSRYAPPFVSVNCAAMPESLLESELFGYEKGAFTDARAEKKGLFEMAKGGSILLDEIGDMTTSLQSKFLRVLEERTIRRVGGKEEILIDTTVIATTNINLAEAVKNNQFRKDLFFRLSAFYMHIPPLRERPEDIPMLLSHFLSHYSTRY